MTPPALAPAMPTLMPRPSVPVRTLPPRPPSRREFVPPAAPPISIPSTRPGDFLGVFADGDLITDAAELGRQITASAVGGMGEDFAVGCRSTLVATKFATPLRSMLLALTSGFSGTGATVSPNLLLHTFPAMESLVRHLEADGNLLPWQPVGERSIGVGTARHLFVSYDTPMPADSQDCRPNTVLEVVGAHLIPAEWFDAVVAPKCDLASLTIVCYGMAGVQGSLFERAWRESSYRGLLNGRR